MAVRNIYIETDSWVVIPTESGPWLLFEVEAGSLITTPNDDLMVFESYEDAWASIPSGKKPEV